PEFIEDATIVLLRNGLGFAVEVPSDEGEETPEESKIEGPPTVDRCNPLAMASVARGPEPTPQQQLATEVGRQRPQRDRFDCLRIRPTEVLQGSLGRDDAQALRLAGRFCRRQSL